MTLGYDGPLFILAFDHRGSFRKRFGISGMPSPDELKTLQDAKMLVFEGFLEAAGGGEIPGAGVLVDEEMGAAVAERAAELGMTFAMPVEKSGQDVFDFEYEDWGAHIEQFDPAFSKVLVRWNPGDDPEGKRDQGARLRELSDWLHDRDRKFLFELLVPATEDQLASVGGDGDRYDTELRPALTLQSMAEIREAGIEPDVWKIEGLDERDACSRIGEFITAGGRDQVVAVVLGRGADDAKVDHWLTMGAPVPGYVGFAIGRSIWGPGIDGFVSGELDREKAARMIADSYLRFHDVYRRAQD